MSYIVLARRYRPQTFDQIIGQEHISRTLKNAISENRVAHAYLFSGPRGVGKTTMARILAKALNCQKGHTQEPCDTCSNCQEITAGTSVDVQEIDGASNRGIDEIRALRENVKFAPASSPYKIYIIDEAHQITDAAFNALLKTLEEPPAHVVFILATTEPQKIPLTILSRCQRYRFRLLSSKEIHAHLASIVKSEKLSVDSEALQVITTSSGGSLRDALSLLDQALSFVSGTVTLADIQNLLGVLPKEIIYATADALSKRDSAQVLSIIKDVTEQGHSLLQFGREVREHFRHLLLANVNPGILELPADEKKRVEQQVGAFTQPWLIRAGRMLSQCLDEMRWSEQPRLLIELSLLRLAQPYAAVDELIERLEKLEKGGSFEPEPVPVRAPNPAPAPAPRPVAPEISAEPVLSESEPEAVPGSDEDVVRTWQAVVAEIRRARPVVGGILVNTSAEGISGNVLVIAVENKFQEDGIARNQQLIEDIVEKKTGRRLGIRVSKNKRKAAAAEPAVQNEVIIVKEEEDAPPSPVVYQVESEAAEVKDALPQGVDKILNKFPGKIKKKKP